MIKTNIEKLEDEFGLSINCRLTKHTEIISVTPIKNVPHQNQIIKSLEEKFTEKEFTTIILPSQQEYPLQQAPCVFYRENPNPFA